MHVCMYAWRVKEWHHTSNDSLVRADRASPSFWNTAFKCICKINVQTYIYNYTYIKLVCQIFLTQFSNSLHSNAFSSITTLTDLEPLKRVISAEEGICQECFSRRPCPIITFRPFCVHRHHGRNAKLEGWILKEWSWKSFGKVISVQNQANKAQLVGLERQGQHVMQAMLGLPYSQLTC